MTIIGPIAKHILPPIFGPIEEGGSGAPGELPGGGSLLQPSSISGLELWLRSDRNVTLDTGVVASWGSIVNSSRVASEATNRPGFTAANSTLNNKPSVDFDGSNDVLTIAHDTWQNPTANGLSVYAVGHFTTAGSGTHAALSKWNNAGPFSWQIRILHTSGDANFLLRDSADTATYSSVVSGAGGGAKKFLGFRFVSANFTGRVQSTSVSDTSKTGSNASTANLTFGAASDPGQFEACSLAEIVIYNKRLSDSELQLLIGYVNSRYGMAVAL